MNGGHCAFPGDRDPRGGCVDFYAIIRAKQVAYHVALSTRISDGQFKFVIPKEYDQCSVVGVVHVYPMRVHCLSMPFDLIDKHKVRKGGYYEITVSKRDSSYFTGADEWPRINSATNL